jgi:hypothetical protein
LRIPSQLWEKYDIKKTMSVMKKINSSGGRMSLYLNVSDCSDVSLWKGLSQLCVLSCQRKDQDFLSQQESLIFLVELKRSIQYFILKLYRKKTQEKRCTIISCSCHNKIHITHSTTTNEW